MLDAFILGKGALYSADSEITGLNNNIIVCGGTGCGKSMSVAVPSFLVTYDSSAVITTSDKELVETHAPLFREYGYDVKVLDTAKPEKSDITFNPLSHMFYSGDAADLARSVLTANRNDSEPFWESAARDMLESEIIAVLGTEENPTFSDVLAFHNTLSAKDADFEDYTEVFEKLKTKSRAGAYAASKWANIESFNQLVYSRIYSAVSEGLGRLTAKKIRKITDTGNEFDFQSVAERKTVVFVYVPAASKAQQVLADLFYGQLIRELIEFAQIAGRKRRVPVRLILDDFAMGTEIPGFAERIDAFSDADISAMMMIRSNRQLRNVYGRCGASAITDSCDTYVYMGGTDPATAGYVAKRMEIPRSFVLFMPANTEIIFRRGSKPLITEKCDALFAA
jgi:type IV secretory pathway TraG/TraD family ATPase VirD4